MILLFLNSFCGFFFQSLIVKAACLRMQSDYLGSTLILCFLYLGFSRGCGLGKGKSVKAQEKTLLSLASAVPILMVQVGTLIEMVPALAPPLQRKLESLGMTESPMVIMTFAGLILIFMVGFMSGYEMVCLYNVVAEKKTKLVVALSYFGALLAGLIASLYSFHHDSLLRDLCLMTITYLGTGIYFLFRFRQPLFTKISAACFLALSAYFSHLIYAKIPDMKSVSRGALYGRMTAAEWAQSRDPQVETIVSPFQRLDIVRFQKPAPYFQLFLNEDFQFDSADQALYHEPFLKGALYFRPTPTKPQKILILGGGDGLLATEIFKVLGDFTEITMVELDPEVTNQAKEKWPQLLDHTFDKKIKIIFDDAFRFLRNHPLQYDLVLIDFPDPKAFDTAKLYSVEMYEMVRRVLRKDGSITLDFPFLNAQGTLVSTLDAAGFHNKVFFGQGHKFFYADPGPARTDLADLSLKSPFPVYSQDTANPATVNSVFRPTLPAGL